MLIPTPSMDTPIVLRCARHGEPVLGTTDGFPDFRCVRCLTDGPPTRWERWRKEYVTDPGVDLLMWAIALVVIAWLLTYAGVLTLLERLGIIHPFEDAAR